MNVPSCSQNNMTDHEYVRPVNIHIRKDLRTSKRARKVMSLSEKMDILNELNGGVSVATLCHYRCLSESTVRYIKKSEDKIKASIKAGAPLISKVTYISRDPLIEKMEKSLTLWIDERGEKDDCPTGATRIRNKALQIYNQLKVETKANTTFLASRGWFSRYQKRIRLGSAGMLDDNFKERFHEELQKKFKNGEWNSTHSSLGDLDELELEETEEKEDSDVDGCGELAIEANNESKNLSDGSEHEMEELDDDESKTLQSKSEALIEVIEIANLLQQKVDEVDHVLERRDLFKCILKSAILPYVKMYNDLSGMKQNNSDFVDSSDVSSILIKEENL
ncbi:uncharacterized protein LOC143914610 [Arctopsyche grandis]|uniref:uncharacterized protein LOC143914610 n=1 Tax=Arctopsyche grandis TaxID=121162 RepID=UPI00406DA141